MPSGEELEFEFVKMYQKQLLEWVNPTGAPNPGTAAPCRVSGRHTMLLVQCSSRHLMQVRFAVLRPTSSPKAVSPRLNCGPHCRRAPAASGGPYQHKVMKGPLLRAPQVLRAT